MDMCIYKLKYDICGSNFDANRYHVTFLFAKIYSNRFLTYTDMLLVYTTFIILCTM